MPLSRRPSKAAIGLDQVDNTSDATKNSASVTLTNKTLTTPTIASFTNATHDHTNAAGGGQLTASTALSATGTPSGSTYLRGDNTWTAITTGDASTNTASSVDSEIALFSGTGGKTLKRATGTGIATVTSGVLGTVATPSGAIVGTTDTQTLTNKTITLPSLTSISTSTPTNVNYPIANNAGQYPAFSSIPKYLWHDNLRFNRWTGTPTYETYNGSWSAQTLNTLPFNGKESQSLQLANGTSVTAVRWIWNHGNFAYGYAYWWCIGFPYIGVTAPAHTVTIESSIDGSAWTTRHTSTNVTANGTPVWFYESDHGGDTYVRLTITSTNSQPITVSAIKALSPRWGNQGGGSEYELPYDWDNDRKITIGTTAGARSDGVLNIGTTTSTAAADGMYFGNDTNLYRSAANTLRTDDSLIIGTAGTAAGSAATIDGTQILTNKTISGSSNTISNIAQSSVTNLTTDLATKVTGPASVTDNRITRYDGTTGKLVQDSSASIDDSGNAIFGIGLSGPMATPGYVDIGTSYGNSTAGSANNLKLKVYTGYGLGVSGGRLEIQSTGNTTFYLSGAQIMHLTSTGPTISASGTATGSIVSIDGTQTLTNKTISGSSNTITNLSASSLTSGVLPRTAIGIQDFTNLAAGSDFEGATHPWGTGTNWSVATDQFHSGAQSYKHVAGGGGSSVLQGTFQVQEGERIQIELWARRDATYNGTDGNSKLRVANAADNSHLNSITYGTGGVPVADTWTRRTGTITVPAGVTAATFTLQDDSTTGNLWIDDIVIRRVPLSWDGNFFLQDETDNTKQLQFQLNGITTATTRTLTVPDASTTIVGTDTTQTLTNKTLTTPVLNGTPTGTSLATAATASTLALRDSSANLTSDNFIASTTSTPTAAGITALDINSTQVQVFTGVTTQTVRLPTTSVAIGQTYTIVNNSTGAVSVQSSSGNAIATMAADTVGMFTSRVATPTSNTQWIGSIKLAGDVLTVNNSLTLAGTDGTTMTFPSSSGNVVTEGATQTLTSKTLSAPTFSGAYSFGGTPTWPTFNQNTTGSAGTLTTSRNFQTDLASTSAVGFNGSANITPGVTGILGVANGGTGRNTATTAYGVLAAGTTATGIQQTIAPGTSGHFLKSGGGSALASFAAITAADITGTTAQFNTALSDGDFATLAGSETLTNKTINGANNTLTNIPIENLTSTTNVMTGYNPDFASNITGWTVTSGTWAYDGTVGRTANGSARFTATGVQGEFSSPTIPVVAGGTYMLEVWVSGSGITNTVGDVDMWVEDYTGATLNGQWLLDGWTSGWPSYNNVPASFAWRRLYGQFDIGTGIDGIRMVFNVDSTVSAGSIYFDDARIVALGVDQEMIAGIGNEIDDIWDGAGTMAEKTLNNTNTVTLLDTNFTLQDDADNTKTVKFNLSSIATATAVTLNVPSVTGSNTLVTLNSNATLQSKRIVPRVTPITSSATPTFNTDTCDLLDITALATNITSMSASGDTPSGNMTGSPNNGQKLMIRIKGDATPRTITWGPKFQSSGTATLLATTAANKEHSIFLVYSSTVSKWVCLAVDSTGY